MGDIADLVKDIQAGAKGPGGAVIALDFLEGAVSTIANISAALTALQSIPALRDLLGTTTSQDEISQILQKFNELFDALGAIEESNRNIQITIQLGQSRSQLRPIREHEPPDFGGNRSNMETFSSNVVETFKQDSDFWRRLFLKEFLYADPWAGVLQPDHPGFQVFEYVQMLPPFVESICNRLCVLRALFDDFPHHQGIPEELNELAQSLQHFHDKIANGIVTERPPTIPEIVYQPVSSIPPVETESIWDSFDKPPFPAPIHGFRNFGVVQIDTGVASIGRYPDDRFPDRARATGPIFPSVQFENDYKRFLAKHAVATAARFKHLYSDIGLSSTWRTIIHLKQLAGVPVGVVERLDTGSFWSLREVNRLVKQNLRTFSPKATVSLAKLMVLLDVKTPVFNLMNPESDVSRPVSVKGMLEVDAI